MINPAQVHRARGVVIEVTGEVTKSFRILVLRNGCSSIVEGFDFNGLKVGDVVNVQCQFSIFSDKYYVKTANKVQKVEIINEINVMAKQAILAEFKRALNNSAIEFKVGGQ